MAKFDVTWAKTYIVTGVCEIESATRELAEAEMDTIIGDQTGSMQYVAGRNSIHAVQQREE
jgi:hypothetical protein